MDDDQQFCLRWNNHQSTLVSVFDTLLEKGMHVDCTLAAEGQTLKAHKVVLSACSPYFESVLSQQYDKHPIIILKDVKYAELRAMMDYMYRGEVNISQDQLAALLKAAESLQIKGLSDNKPSRPPSRPAAAAQPAVVPPAHPPRQPSPPPQVRDGSIDSREGSSSPTRRRKKRRISVEVPGILPIKETAVNNNGQDDQTTKDENARDGLDDLTIDEEGDEPPVAHNDVVRNFQWHMERSQDEIMNSSDSARESQGSTKKSKSKKKETLEERPAVATLAVLKNVTSNLKADSKNIDMDLKPKLSDSDIDRKIELFVPSEPPPPEYKCSKCHRCYNARRNLVRHLTVECGREPQHKCPYCSCSKHRRNELKKHITTKHSDKPNIK